MALLPKALHDSGSDEAAASDDDDLHDFSPFRYRAHQRDRGEPIMGARRREVLAAALNCHGGRLGYSSRGRPRPPPMDERRRPRKFLDRAFTAAYCRCVKLSHSAIIWERKMRSARNLLGVASIILAFGVVAPMALGADKMK